MLTRSLLLALTVLAMCAAPCAQTSVGVRAGMTVSTLSGGHDDAFEAQIVPAVGVFLAHSVAERLAIRTELNLGQRRVTGAADGVDHGATYIEAPVLLVIAGPRLINIEPSAFVGPMLGIAVGRVGVEVVPAGRVDPGVTVGAEVSTPLRGRPERFGLGVRFTFGFGPTGHLAGQDLRHRALTVAAHFQF